MTNKKFETIPVMLTPFKANGEVDFEALRQLTEFYMNTGSTGLFTNCLSSEMFQLSEDERLEVTRTVVEQVNGRQKVVATGTFGYDQDKNIDFIKRIYDTGVYGVILNSNQLAYQSETDEDWKVNVEKILTATDNIDLGVYECPLPYKRLLTPKITKWLGATGRFKFLKDTSCNLKDIKLKLKAVEGTPLGIYNANIATGLDSIKEGAKGLASTASNFYPEFIHYLSESSDLAEANLNKLNAFITVFDTLINVCYPMSAKYFFRKRGMEINTFTRIDMDGFTYQDYVKFDQLFHVFEVLAEELDIEVYKW